MSQFDEVLGSEYDLEIKKVEGKPGFYQHAVGEYKGMLSFPTQRFVDANNDTCAKDKPGAKVANLQLPIFILQSPDGHGFTGGAEFTIPKDATYGSLVFQQYINLDPDKQFGNKILFEEFELNSDPETKVITPKDPTKPKGAYNVNFDRLKYFAGAPVSFVLNDTLKDGKKSKGIFMTDLKLLNKTITPEFYKNRVTQVKAILSSLEELKRKEENSSGADQTPVPEVKSPSSIASEYE